MASLAFEIGHTQESNFVNYLRTIQIVPKTVTTGPRNGLDITNEDLRKRIPPNHYQWALDVSVNSLSARHLMHLSACTLAFDADHGLLNTLGFGYHWVDEEYVSAIKQRFHTMLQHMDLDMESVVHNDVYSVSMELQPKQEQVIDAAVPLVANGVANSDVYCVFITCSETVTQQFLAECQLACAVVAINAGRLHIMKVMNLLKGDIYTCEVTNPQTHLEQALENYNCNSPSNVTLEQLQTEMRDFANERFVSKPRQRASQADLEATGLF